MSLSVLVALQICALAYAVIAGVFLAFSDFIMRALSRTSGTGGLEAMQVINREVFRWVFMALFLSLAPVSLGLAVYGAVGLGGAQGMLIAAAGLLYVVCCFGVTVVFNVPLNESLAELDRNLDTTLSFWLNTYLPRWTFWNSVRGAACAIAAGLLHIGVVWLAGAGLPPV